MPQKPSTMPWGRYIREHFGDDKYHEYKNEYLKVYRYAQKRENTDMDISAEAARIVMGQGSQLKMIMTQSLGVTDKSRLAYISANIHTEGFQEQNGNVQFIAKDYSAVRYNKDGTARKGTMWDDEGRPYVLRKTTLNRELKRLKEGKTTEQAISKLIKEYKGTVEYLAYGSL